eukprot:TRINITY_DN2226_c0_g2_i1.p1 TRINITY_DN2226_c0_g2~~TRINITY_DN2226_c0_g2_i1.p1  ORF type:complete len:136 (-),score=17.00 TRINITY_DN2226_c0_g2_i1:31-438(-)
MCIRDRSTGVEITYELFDADEDNDEVIDINPSPNKRFLTFSFDTLSEEISGDVNGMFTSITDTVRSAGDSNADAGAVEFYIETLTVGSCNGNSTGNPECETYVNGVAGVVQDYCAANVLDSWFHNIATFFLYKSE